VSETIYRRTLLRTMQKGDRFTMPGDDRVWTLEEHVNGSWLCRREGGQGLAPFPEFEFVIAVKDAPPSSRSGTP
jgi:hypothetical protein